MRQGNRGNQPLLIDDLEAMRNALAVTRRSRPATVFSAWSPVPAKPARWLQPRRDAHTAIPELGEFPPSSLLPSDRVAGAPEAWMPGQSAVWATGSVGPSAWSARAAVL